MTPSFISYKVCFWRTSGQKKVWKICGGEAAVRTPYIFYKPTFGPKLRKIPYNEFITPRRQRLSKLSDKMLKYASLYKHMGCFERLYICRPEINGRLYFKRYDL